jgi:hypothetical protein
LFGEQDFGVVARHVDDLPDATVRQLDPINEAQQEIRSRQTRPNECAVLYSRYGLRLTIVAAMPRTNHVLPSRASRPVHAQMLSGDNGNGPPAAEPDRLAKIETLLDRMQHMLDVQFQRIADLQVQLDRAIAARPITPQR